MIRIEDIPEDQVLIYDLETTSQYSPYCDITLIGVQYGFNGKYEKVEHYKDQIKFKKRLADPDFIKIGFNNLNFDNIVLERYGFSVNEKNCHDGYLMIKTICPKLPAYGLKFLCWWFLGDMHLPEMKLEAWAKKNKIDKWAAPNELLEPYLAHDLIQHRDIFRLGWEIVQEPKHWDAYQLDMSQGYVTREMILKGGLHIDKQLNKNKIAILQKQVEELQDAGRFHSDWRVDNLNSSKQLGNFFDEEGFAMELSANGDFAVRKSDLLDLRDRHIVGEIAYQIRKINGSLSFFKNYERALGDSTYNDRGLDWIPTSFSISNARTRRYTSNSQHGLNFQNPDKEAKKVQIVPQGWLGFWQDATQVENIVHIYESEDDIRRQAYEANPDWSEYVWLCNLILGSEKSKEELDSIPSPQVPNWSIYKQFKTAKLALNFGMGVSKFCKTTGVSPDIGKSTFDQIHEACPAIHKLQHKVRKLLEKYGYVQDVFGHIYSDTPRMAYKCVAYLIQGCGTGSLPKAQMRANFDTLRDYDSGNNVSGHLSITTHDEVGGRLNLELGSNKIFAILQDFQYNATKRFSSKFDNIPLRSKLYLSRTTAADRIEITNLNKKQIEQLCK